MNTTALGGTDTYLQKFDTDGHLIWAKHMGGVETMIPKSIVTDDDNSVYITGVASQLVFEKTKPSTVNPKKGEIYFDKVTKRFRGWNGSKWVNLNL